MSEMYVTIGIPAEYVRGSDESIYLDMPVSYAAWLGQFLIEGVNHSKTEAIASVLAETCEKETLAYIVADKAL